MVGADPHLLSCQHRQGEQQTQRNQQPPEYHAQITHLESDTRP
jgi:hypothetical protein